MRFCRRLAAHLPGWSSLICGLTLIGLTVLMPVYRDLEQMQWRRDLMRAQGQQLAEQTLSYRQFHTALVDDDPIVLERLAYYQLHLKPAGTEPLATPGEGSTWTWVNMPGASRTPGWDDMPTIEALLYRPLPREGVDCYAPLPPDSRLTRLTSGSSQLVLAAAGLMLVYVGMLLPIGAPPAPGDRKARRRPL